MPDVTFLPSTQAFGIPDNYCNTLFYTHTAWLQEWLWIPGNVLIKKHIVVFDSQLSTAAKNNAHTCFSSVCTDTLWQESEQSIQNFQSLALREACPLVEDIGRISSYFFLSLWKKNRMEIGVWGAAGLIFCLAEEADKKNKKHWHNKRYPGDMSRQLCHYLSLWREPTIFWEYHVQIHVVSSTDSTGIILSVGS